ncbi:MAG: hypothetical protein K2J40_04220 [Ruminococcus sp.]|nr:hypothetical protein [Ruminococcus sp.]
MESEKIHILIELLNQIRKLNIKNPSVVSSNSRSANLVMIQALLYDSMVITSDNSDIPLSYIENIMTDINATDKREFQLVHFCYYVIDWLVTGDKTTLKEVLIKNISEDSHDSDLQAIETLYRQL